MANYLDMKQIQDPAASKEEQIRKIKKERCRLLEGIHQKQQELDRLDYVLQKMEKNL